MLTTFVHRIKRLLGLTSTKEQRVMARACIPLTATTIARTLYWHRLLTRVQHLPGVIVECGVGGGNSLIMIGGVLRALRSAQPLIGCDTFTGFPAPSLVDGARAQNCEGLSAYPCAYVEQLLAAHLGDHHRVRLLPGPFSKTLPQWSDPIALLHLDCDLYTSYRTCFEQLTPHLLPGAIIAVDEYADEAHRWPGGICAVDDWCARQGWTVQRDPLERKHYIVVGESSEQPIAADIARSSCARAALEPAHRRP